MECADTTDTDAEVSFNASFKKKVQTYDSLFMRSVFNITLADTATKSESAQFKDLEKKLNEERLEWSRMWKKSKKALKTADSAKYAVDISLLPEDKRKYLEEAPNFQMFIHNSIAFRETANIFLNFHLPEYLEMQHNFKTMYEHRLHVLKENAVKELLDGKTPIIEY